MNRSDIKTDIVIIGGGVIGTAIARELSRYQLGVVLVEKEDDIAMGSSKANSGIVHAGYNADCSSLKGQLNAKANPTFDKLCKDLQVPFSRIGSLVVGFNDKDLKTLKWEKENGEKMGVRGLEIISGNKLFEIEPNLNPEAKYALYAPTAGIVSSYELTIALADSAAVNGVKVMLETKVIDLIKDGNEINGIKTNKGNIYCSIVINAAGLFADEIAGMAGQTAININPRKGEYHLYDKCWGEKVNHVLFPTPTKISKGILVTPTAHGNLMIGPNSDEVREKTDLTTTEQGLNKVFTGAKKLVPDISRQDIITSFAGLRAADSSGDFVIEPSKNVKGLINAAGIQSPGLSSAPAVAEMVVDIVDNVSQNLNTDFELNLKADFQNKLPERYIFTEMDNEKWQQIVKKNKDYGQIICRCEKVTKGEIMDAIHRPVPARSVDAVKRRTRAGTGRCQGGFCGPQVLEILSEELNIPAVSVTKKGEGSEILAVGTKDLLLEAGDNR
ncbi:MAG: NAD(P)/FAD-dependent oxidoreductase [Halothermotrichaceae bacterium]